jgi:protein-tyrosine phosphatase
MPHQTVLFLCTGNYYRSRFAEYLFNTVAQQRNLPWRARSRGLSTATGKWKVGPISHYAVAALRQRNIPLPDFIREPLFCTEDDLCHADLVIALKEAEHRPMLEKCYPDHCPRVEFWHVHDVDKAHPEQALAELETLLHDLIARLETTPVPQP